jgi:serine/threonine protein kinase
MSNTSSISPFYVGAGLIQESNSKPDFGHSGLADMYAGASRYEVVQSLSQSSTSQSGSAEIFGAHDLHKVDNDAPDVALKISRIPAHFMYPTVGRSIESVYKMYREYLAQEKLFVHGASVPKPIDFTFFRSFDSQGNFQDFPVIAMERIFGTSLRDVVYQGLSIEDAFQIGRQIAGFLNVSHGLGIIHRDIKPANAMLEIRKEGGFDVTVLDLGNSNFATAGTDIVEGADGYTAPELYRREEPSITDDNYGMFSTLFYMLTGNAFVNKDMGIFRRYNPSRSGPYEERWKGTTGKKLDALFVELMLGRGGRIPIYRDHRTAMEMLEYAEHEVNGILRL